MKKLNLFMLSTSLLLFLGAVEGAKAAPMQCPAMGNYQTLLNTNTNGGCTIQVSATASLLFENFTFAPAGAGAPMADAVGYTLDDPGSGAGGTQIWGFEFNPGLSVSGANNIQDVLLMYTVVPTGTTITSDELMENAAATGTGVGQTSEVLQFCLATDPNNTSGTCHMFPGNPLLVSTVTPPGLSDNQTFALPWTSMAVSKDINAASGTGGTATISQVRDAVDLSTSTSTPEPVSSVLLGSALAGFGLLLRRYRRAIG